MYRLIVEAGGLRQLRRVLPDWAREFTENLTKTVADHRGRITRDSGDVIVADLNIQPTPTPHQIIAFVQAVFAVTHRASDQLLSFSIVIDYVDGDLSSTDRLDPSEILRHVRDDNSIWVTDPVKSALSSVATIAGRAGKLHRVGDFVAQATHALPGFAQVVVDETISGEIARMLSMRARGTTIHLSTADIPAGVIAARQAVFKFRHHATSVAQVRPQQAVLMDLSSAVAVAVLRALPPEVADLGAGLPPRRQHVLSRYRERFASFAEQYLSCGYREGEAAYGARLMVEAIVRTEQIPSVLIVYGWGGDIEVVLSTITAMLETADPARSIAVIVIADQLLDHTVTQTFRLHETRPSALSLFQQVTERNVERISDYSTITEQYWVASALTRSDDWQPGDPALATLIRSLPEEQKRLLVLLRLSAGLLTRSQQDGLLAACSIGRAERTPIVQELTNEGIVDDPMSGALWPQVDLDTIRELIEPEFEELTTRIGAELAGAIDLGEVRLSPELWIVFGPLFPSDRTEDLWLTLVGSLANGPAHDILEALVDGHAPYERTGQLVGDAGRLTARLRNGVGPAQSGELSQRITAAADQLQLSAPVARTVDLALGEFELAQRQYTSATANAKRVIARDGDSAGYLLMSRIMLSQGRLNDAASYLNYAREESRTRHGAVHLVARTLELVRLFLHGDFTRVQRESESLERALIQEGFTEWLLLLYHLRGRVVFELGEYRQAADVFSELAEFCLSGEIESAAIVAEAWNMRAQIYGGNDPNLGGVPKEASSELHFVYAEYLVMQERFDQAQQVLQGVIESERSAERWPRLGVNWENGFATVEDLVVSGTGGETILGRLCLAYSAWIAAREGEVDRAAPTFRRLTRDVGLLTHDPYGAWYHYLYSTVLPTERSPERDDRLTVLAKSVKYLQERTSRIERYQDKLRYSQSNLWNRQIIAAARQHNLM